MPYCVNGSEVAAGAPSYVWVNEAVARAILPDWAHFVIPYLPFAQGGELIPTANICATEPDPEAAFPLSDFIDGVMDRNPAQLAQLGEKVYQYLLANLWDDYCVCSAVTAQTGVLLIDQTIGPLAASGGQFVVTTAKAQAGSVPTNYEINRVSGSGYDLAAAWEPIYPTPLWFNVVLNSDRTGSTLPNGRVMGTGGEAIKFYERHGLGSVSFRVRVWGNIPGYTPVYTPPAIWTEPADLPAMPGIVCSTTEDLCAEIASLRTRLGIMGDMITLIQRQAVPFAYIQASSQSISGSGQITVQGILALSVDFTAIPASKGQRGTTIVDRFDLGYLSFGTTDGWVERVILRHDPQLVGDVPPYVTRVGYDLAPGVTATLKTFRREF